jgi:Protein of unknown function (DUF1579)
MTQMEKPQPQKEHEWLSRLAGDWTFEGEASMGPDQPMTKFNGTEHVRMLGDVWFIAEGTNEVPGGSPHRSIMTIGYDPAKQRFVGTFVASMMTYLWLYEGSLDDAGKILTLESEGPAMSSAGTAKYLDAIEIESDDRRIMTSRMQGEDGSWTEMMRMTYTRAK